MNFNLYIKKDPHTNRPVLTSDYLFVYWYSPFNDDMNRKTVEAKDREHAKKIIREKFPSAVFWDDLPP